MDIIIELILSVIVRIKAHLPIKRFNTVPGIEEIPKVCFYRELYVHVFHSHILEMDGLSFGLVFNIFLA